MTFESGSDAMQFYVTRILSQAEREGVTLSETERRMLSWSGSDLDLAVDSGALQRPEEGAAELAFEAKVAGLIRRAFDRDVAADKGTESLYREAEAKLDEDDHYISLIIYDAFHSRPKRRWWPF
jgi:hypothetical protein